MKSTLSLLGLSATLVLAGCIPTDEPTQPSPPLTDVATDETCATSADGSTPSCCTPMSLRDLPLPEAEPTDEVVAAQPPAAAPFAEEEELPKPFPATELPEGKFTKLTKAGHLQLQAHPETGKPWRVWVKAEVCLREGPPEVFVCKKGTKEHESILAADLDGRTIHTALVAIGAKPGKPAVWEPDYKPASGATIEVTVYHRPKADAKPEMLSAKQWIRDIRTKKPMTAEWVFAGSRMLQDQIEPDRPPFYAANNGEFISVSNFVDSMLDVAEKSSKDAGFLNYQIETKKIPPLGTQVWVVLEPAKKKG